MQRGRVRLAFAISGVKPEKAKDAQIILGDAGGGIADEANAPRFEIGKPADIVVHRTVTRCRQGVHREVAPLRIAPPVAPERHLGLAAIGFDILAQGGDLEWNAFAQDRHRAMRDSGRNDAQTRGLGALHDLVRHGGGGDVDFVERLIDQRIADRTADHARLFAVTVEDRENIGQRSPGQPRGIAKMRPPAVHLKCPGTSLPSSIWGGT